MKKHDTKMTIKIPLPKVFAQESKYNVKHQNNKKFLQENRYSNTASSSRKKRILPEISQLRGKAIQTETFLSHRLYEKNLGKIMRLQSSAVELENKYKIKYDELCKRLYVDDPIDDVKTVTDIDERYFKYLNNHGPTGYVPSYKSLRYVWHAHLRLKQDIGYRRDAVLQIEFANKREIQVYDKSVKEYMENVKQFDNFIADDYAKSINILRKSEELHSSKIISTLLELEHYATLQCIVQSQLISIDYLYHTQQKYGRFLYYLSPPSWRAKHRDFAQSLEIETLGFDLGVFSEEDPFQVVFEKIRNECLSGLIKPVLYFSHPSEIATIFETIEQQQLHHFTHVLSLRPVTAKLIKEIKYLKLGIKKDTDFLALLIENIERLIDFNEERADQLKKKFMKILHDFFYDCVASTDALKLKMNLEWCFERVFMEKSILTLRNTAKAMEEMYMKYTYELDIISNEEINIALKQSIAEDKNKMLKAKKAATELRLFNRLEKSLLRAYSFDKKYDNVKENTEVNIKRPLVRKLKQKQAETTLRRSSHRELTDEEIEYLTLFTNWTEKKDPAKYLKSF